MSARDEGPCVGYLGEQHCLEGSGKPREVIFTKLLCLQSARWVELG